MRKRQSMTRPQFRAALATGIGRPVILDIRDDVDILLGRKTNDPIAAQIEACRRIGSDANIIVGEAEYLPAAHPLGRKRTTLVDDPAHTVIRIEQPTPLGPLFGEEIAEPGQKPARTQMFLKEEADYAKAIALMRALRDCRADITARLAAMRREIGDAALFTVFVPQPLEMFFLILHDNMVLHYLDWPDTYQAAMREVEDTAHAVIDCAADADADMIMLGGAGTEIFSPDMIERHIVRPGEGYIRHSRERGLFSLMHCCGRTRVFLERGWFERIRPTIFESFTEAPLGDIASPPEAVRHLPPETFFKGGLSLDLLRRGSPAEAADAARRACALFGSRRFILAGTCAILTGTPLENLQAAAAASLYGRNLESGTQETQYS